MSKEPAVRVLRTTMVVTWFHKTRVPLQEKRKTMLMYSKDRQRRLVISNYRKEIESSKLVLFWEMSI